MGANQISGSDPPGQIEVMKITYHASKIDPNIIRVAIDNVVVAFWHESWERWIIDGVYRPIRSKLSVQIEWTGKQFIPEFGERAIDQEEFEIVKKTGREWERKE